MSKADAPTERLDEKRQNRLEKLYEVHEELQLLADSETAYAPYAENFLETLREAGYDV